MNKVKYLLTYRYAEIIHDLTVEFTKKYTLSRLSNLSNLSHLGEFREKPSLVGNPQDDANFLLTLCHQETYLLSRQIESAEEKFIQEGGYSENLFKRRRGRGNT